MIPSFLNYFFRHVIKNVFCLTFDGCCCIMTAPWWAPAMLRIVGCLYLSSRWAWPDFWACSIWCWMLAECCAAWNPATLDMNIIPNRKKYSSTAKTTIISFLKMCLCSVWLYKLYMYKCPDIYACSIWRCLHVSGPLPFWLVICAWSCMHELHRLYPCLMSLAKDVTLLHE